MIGIGRPNETFEMYGIPLVLYSVELLTFLEAFGEVRQGERSSGQLRFAYKFHIVTKSRPRVGSSSSIRYVAPL